MTAPDGVAPEVRFGVLAPAGCAAAGVAAGATAAFVLGERVAAPDVDAADAASAGGLAGLAGAAAGRMLALSRSAQLLSDRPPAGEGSLPRRDRPA